MQIFRPVIINLLEEAARSAVIFKHSLLVLPRVLQVSNYKMWNRGAMPAKSLVIPLLICLFWRFTLTSSE